MKTVFAQKDIEASLTLLFEKYGFRYTEVNQFEEYTLYLNHKSFFQAENLITFTNMDSNVLVLKPDITLSLAKNSQKECMPVLQKLYYLDEIYRYDVDCGEYKALKQIGIEVMGQSTLYMNLEVIAMALDALACIDETYILDISHSGFLAGLFQSVNLSESTCEQLISAIDKKSIHDIELILGQENVDESFIDKMRQLIKRETIDEKLETIQPWIENQTMQEAYEELLAIDHMLALLGKREKVNLDFSASGDLEYYNGLVLSGYIDGVSKRILTGGRYDNLMRKLNNENDAFGFALNLSQLCQNNTIPKPTVDILIYYDEKTDPVALFGHVKTFMNANKSIRTEQLKSITEPLPVYCKEVYIYQEGVLKKMETKLC